MEVKQTFMTYPESWVFTIYREKGRLRARGAGRGQDSEFYESRFEYQDKSWKLKRLAKFGNQNAGISAVSSEIEKEMFRQFAAYKGRYLSAAGKKLPKENESLPSPGEGGTGSRSRRL